MEQQKHDHRQHIELVSLSRLFGRLARKQFFGRVVVNMKRGRVTQLQTTESTTMREIVDAEMQGDRADAP